MSSRCTHLYTCIYTNIDRIQNDKLAGSLVPSAPAGKSYQMDHALGHHWSRTGCSPCSSYFVAWWFPETKFLLEISMWIYFKFGSSNGLCLMYNITMLIKKTPFVKTYRGTDNDWSRWNFKQNLVTSSSITIWWSWLTIVVGLRF